MKILMVCLGNICRSPLADALFAKKAAEKHLDWRVDSAGTGGWHAGEKPDRRAIAVAWRHGVDLNLLRARKFEVSDFDRFDKIFAMDKQNLADILAQARTAADREKVELLLENGGEVPDPYFNDADFEPVFWLIEAACARAVERLEKEWGA